MEVPFFCSMLQIPEKGSRVYYLHLLLSGLLLWLSWPHFGFTLLIFVAWVPLLLAEDKIKSPYGFFFTLWASFLIWNIGTTWWIWNSTGPGAVGAIVANSLIMCFPVMAYRFSKKHLPLWQALVAFILYWITYEFIHHNWDLSWPWLTLGNAFATKPTWIQWYKFTGTTGGSLWVLVINTIVFYELKLRSESVSPKFTWWRWGIVIGLLIPVTTGWIFMPKQEDVLKETQKGNAYNVVVVQPNVEPYEEKFNTDPNILTQSLIDLSKSKIDSNTRLLVWPETAIPAQAWEHEIADIPIFQKVFDFLNGYPHLQLVTGIDSYKLWGNENPGGMTIRQMRNGQYYEAFNTALRKSAADPFTLYHKSKLVPGVESLPSWLGFMSSVFDDFGGINGSLGKSDSAMVFSTTGNPYRPAPVICYESIYSDYLTEYTRRGANIITVITNDGWWGNTPGHHQHMHYARLRAIETGLWVARSANTGISCFIDPFGNIYQPQPWEKQAAIKMEIPPVENVSFYATHYDWLSRMLLVPAIAFFLLTLILKWKKRRP
jgi:apolipoprotein N-acyltransferase